MPAAMPPTPPPWWWVCPRSRLWGSCGTCGASVQQPTTGKTTVRGFDCLLISSYSTRERVLHVMFVGHHTNRGVDMA